MACVLSTIAVSSVFYSNLAISLLYFILITFLNRYFCFIIRAYKVTWLRIEVACDIITACVVLHNIAKEFNMPIIPGSEYDSFCSK